EQELGAIPHLLERLDERLHGASIVTESLLGDAREAHVELLRELRLERRRGALAEHLGVPRPRARAFGEARDFPVQLLRLRTLRQGTKQRGFGVAVPPQARLLHLGDA